MKVSLIFPVFNEEEAIGSDLRTAIDTLKATDWEWEIIVVDDASRDRTAEIAASFPEVTLVRHPYNMGGGGRGPPASRRRRER